MSPFIFPLAWMDDPPDPQRIDAEAWLRFADSIAGWWVLTVILTCSLIVAVYAWAARRRKIRSVQDVFGPYGPMRALFLSVLAALFMFFLFDLEYARRFTGALSATGTGVFVALWAAAWALWLGYLLICLPGITPAKYRHRPVAFLHRRG